MHRNVVILQFSHEILLDQVNSIDHCLPIQKSVPMNPAYGFSPYWVWVLLILLNYVRRVKTLKAVFHVYLKLWDVTSHCFMGIKAVFILHRYFFPQLFFGGWAVFVFVSLLCCCYIKGPGGVGKDEWEKGQLICMW